MSGNVSSRIRKAFAAFAIVLVTILVSIIVMTLVLLGASFAGTVIG